MQDKLRKRYFSPAEKFGIISLLTALLLFFIDPIDPIAPFGPIIPLSIFLLLCFAAPFFPRCNFLLPVISRGKKGSNSIALTFDDGPTPASTPILLKLLARYQLPATFFVIGEKAARYPELIADILAEGHTIGNHSWKHDYFLSLRSQKTLEKDIRATQDILKKSGAQPLVFRPPVGITSSSIGFAVERQGLITVNYSCRALDRGNRNIENLSGKILKNLRPGDIIMLHDLPPHQDSLWDYWQKELDDLFASLAENYDTVPLEKLIQRPVNIAAT